MFREFEKMCCDINFDRTRAEELLRQIDVNQEFADSQYGMRTALLNLAAEWANVPMVELLLKHGADPNLIYDDGTENVLWNLQYYNFDAPEVNDRRLGIVKLLLENGANPHLMVGDEDLYFWATQCHIELDEGVKWDYREKYICLLEEYDHAGDDRRRLL